MTELLQNPYVVIGCIFGFGLLVTALALSMNRKRRIYTKDGDGE